MTLVLRPIGRGNWRAVTARLDGPWLPPRLYFAVNQRLELGGEWFRIVEIRP